MDDYLILSEDKKTLLSVKEMDFNCLDIPYGIIHIGENAFKDCHTLCIINFPNSVTHIGYAAFESCTSLQYIDIPNSVIHIGNKAFRNCISLECMDIPNSVTHIGEAAFEGCTSLNYIDIPNSVTHIGYAAFVDCISLQSINISLDNTVYKSVDGVLYDKHLKTIICIPPKYEIKDFTIPKSITSIENYAFRNCTTLRNIHIPNSVIHIGYEVFYKCSAFLHVNSSAFFNYSEDGKSITPITTKNLKKVVIPDGVTHIRRWAFMDCASLQEIEIPNSITHIEERAFSCCTSLQRINIPNSVTYIGNKAFINCVSLESIDIPNSVVHIGYGAFSGCNSLRYVFIPKNTNHIGLCAFVDCFSLQSINVADDNALYQSIDGVLYDKSIKTIIGFPTNYRNNTFTIPKSVTSIGNYIFYQCRSLKSVDIPNGVTVIGDKAFYCCCSLQNIYIPNSVTNIGEAAFEGCTSLHYIDIPNSIISIKIAAFRGCTTIKDIIIHSRDVEKLNIDESAFDYTLFDHCNLHIPCGTRWTYKHHPIFSKFKNVVTDILE